MAFAAQNGTFRRGNSRTFAVCVQTLHSFPTINEHSETWQKLPAASYYVAAKRSFVKIPPESQEALEGALEVFVQSGG